MPRDTYDVHAKRPGHGSAGIYAYRWRRRKPYLKWAARRERLARRWRGTDWGVQPFVLARLGEAYLLVVPATRRTWRREDVLLPSRVVAVAPGRAAGRILHEGPVTVAALRAIEGEVNAFFDQPLACYLAPRWTLVGFDPVGAAAETEAVPPLPDIATRR